MLQLRSPQSHQEFDRYYDLRWRILRKPWGRPRGSERDSYDDLGIHVMAVDRSDQLLGCGCLHFINPAEAQIRYMAVEEISRGSGVGRAMAEWLEHEAIQRGAISIMLNARESAIGFYERLGYASYAEGETLFGEIKHSRMRKNLNEVGHESFG